MRLKKETERIDDDMMMNMNVIVCPVAMKRKRQQQRQQQRPGRRKKLTAITGTMPKRRREDAPGTVQKYLVENSVIYAESRKKLRTQQHTLFEKFITNITAYLAPGNLQEAPVTESTLTRDFHAGLLGHPKPILRALQRFGDCGIHKDIIRALHTKPQPQPLTEDDMRMFKDWRMYMTGVGTGTGTGTQTMSSHALTPSKFLQVLNTARRNHLDIANAAKLEVRVAARFCLVHGQRNSARVALLLASGFGNTYLDRQIQQYAEDYAEAKSTADELFPASPSTALDVTHLFLDLSDKMGRFRDFLAEVHEVHEFHEVHEVHELLHERVKGLREVVRGMGCGYSALLTLLCRLAEKANRCDIARLLVPAVDILTRVKNLSPWHHSLCEEVARAEEVRGFGSTSYPVNRLRHKMSCFANLILCFEHYLSAEKKIPCLQTFMQSALVADVRRALQVMASNRVVRNDLVKSDKHVHHAKRFVETALHFVRLLKPHWGRCADSLDQLKTQDILGSVPNRRIAADSNQRRAYTDDELARMMDMTMNPAEALFIALLTQVGLRVGALAHLRYDMILTDQHKPRDTCRVPEKGGKPRVFLPSKLLQDKIQALSDHLRQTNPDLSDNLRGCYVLNLRNIRRPLRVATLEQQLRAIGKRAGIEGVHVHPHAFRHTVVNKLVAAGNSLDLISKWLGHSDVKTTTYFYWVPTTEDIRRKMIDPFEDSYRETTTATTATTTTQAQQHTTSGILEAANLKVELCRLIISKFLTDEESAKKVRQQLPDLDLMITTIDRPLALEAIDMIDERNDTQEKEDIEDMQETFAR